MSIRDDIVGTARCFELNGHKDIWVIEASGPGSRCQTKADAVRYRGFVKERRLGHRRGNGMSLFAYVDPLLFGLKHYRKGFVP